MYESAKKPRKCRHLKCPAPAYAAGYCQAHHHERQVQADDPAEALALLERGTTLDDQPLQSSRLRTELTKLQEWWDRACEAATRGRDFYVMPVEEARSALHWCIRLAQQMLLADRGQVPVMTLEQTRSEIWSRFHNLERGLCSDGRTRSRPLL